MKDEIFEGESLMNMVDMLRQGFSFKEISNAVGYKHTQLDYFLKKAMRKNGIDINEVKKDKYRVVFEMVQKEVLKGETLGVAALSTGYHSNSLRVWILKKVMRKEDEDFAKFVIAQARANYLRIKWGYSRQQIEAKGYPASHVPE